MAKDEPGEDRSDDEGSASTGHGATPSAEASVSPTSSDTEPSGETEAAAAEEGEVAAAGEAEAADEPKDAGEPKAAPEPAPVAASGRRASRLWWALPILLVAELYVYGHDGRLQICVGKEGDTDFALVGQERTDENRWKFPRCETRDNLGLRSQHDAQVEQATKVACRGATIFRHQGEAKACVAGEQGWQHQVEGQFVPPWDPAYYRHLFWFLF